MDVLLAKTLSTELLERFGESPVEDTEMVQEMSGSQSGTEGLSEMEEGEREERPATTLLGREALSWPVFAAFNGAMV